MKAEFLTALTGLTWDHPRGYDPLVMSLDHFKRKHPDVNLVWKKRSLNQFGLSSAEVSYKDYDLIIIDHPSIAEAVSTESLLAFDSLVSKSDLDLISNQFMGKSFDSYRYENSIWALPIDAACQVSAFRRDLIVDLPETWEQVIALAKTTQHEVSRVGIPLDPTGCYCSFLTLYCNHGEFPCYSKKVLDFEKGIIVLEILKKLSDLSHPKSLDFDPPSLLDLMGSTREISYVPLIFGYSNYSRNSFRKYDISFSDIPSAGLGPIGSVLGGAGIAVSSSTDHSEIAKDYALWITSPVIQNGPYLSAGGQPASIVTWYDIGANKSTNNFFSNTKNTIVNAYVRPRFPGFIDIQNKSGALIHDFLANNGDPVSTMHELTKLSATIYC